MQANIVLSQMLADQIAQNEKLRNELNDIKTTYESTQNHNDELADQVESLTAAGDDLRKNLEFYVRRCDFQVATVRDITRINEQLEEQLKRANAKIVLLNNTISIDPVKGGVFNITNPTDIIGKKLHKVIEDNRVYGVRHNDVLISSVGTKTGFRARLGDDHITIKYVDYGDPNDVTNYVIRITSNDHCWIFDNDSYKVRMEGDSDIHNKMKRGQIVSIGNGYILKYMSRHHETRDERAIEIIGPNGQPILMTCDYNFKLYLDTDVYVDRACYFGSNAADIKYRKKQSTAFITATR